MRRFELIIRRPDGRVEQARLPPWAAALIALLVMGAFAVLLVLGWLALGAVLALALVGVVVALVAGVARALWRQATRRG